MGRQNAIRCLIQFVLFFLSSKTKLKTVSEMWRNNCCSNTFWLLTDCNLSIIALCASKVINYNVTTLSSTSRFDENVFNSNFCFDNLFCCCFFFRSRLSAPPLTTVKEKFVGLFYSKALTMTHKEKCSGDKDGMSLLLYIMAPLGICSGCA